MQTFQQLLDALAERAGSDRKAALKLGVTQAAFSSWRVRGYYPDDAQAVKMATELQRPVEFVLAVIRADRTDDRTARAAWRNIAERFAVVVLVSASAGILPAPSAAPAQIAGQPCVLCKMRPCRCRPFGPLHSILTAQAAP